MTIENGKVLAAVVAGLVGLSGAGGAIVNSYTSERVRSLEEQVIEQKFALAAAKAEADNARLVAEQSKIASEISRQSTDIAEIRSRQAAADNRLNIMNDQLRAKMDELLKEVRKEGP